MIHSYTNKSLDKPFNEFLNIPQPYGGYWSKYAIKNSMIQLDPDIIKEFSRTYPYQVYYPFENEMNNHCNNYVKQLQNGNLQERDKIIELITKEMHKMEEGAIKG